MFDNIRRKSLSSAVNAFNKAMEDIDTEMQFCREEYRKREQAFIENKQTLTTEAIENHKRFRESFERISTLISNLRHLGSSSNPVFNSVFAEDSSMAEEEPPIWVKAKVLEMQLKHFNEDIANQYFKTFFVHLLDQESEGVSPDELDKKRHFISSCEQRILGALNTIRSCLEALKGNQTGESIHPAKP